MAYRITGDCRYEDRTGTWDCKPLSETPVEVCTRAQRPLPPRPATPTAAHGVSLIGLPPDQDVPSRARQLGTTIALQVVQQALTAAAGIGPGLILSGVLAGVALRKFFKAQGIATEIRRDTRDIENADPKTLGSVMERLSWETIEGKHPLNAQGKIPMTRHFLDWLSDSIKDEYQEVHATGRSFLERLGRMPEQRQADWDARRAVRAQELAGCRTHPVYRNWTYPELPGAEDQAPSRKLNGGPPVRLEITGAPWLSTPAVFSRPSPPPWASSVSLASSRRSWRSGPPSRARSLPSLPDFQHQPPLRWWQVPASFPQGTRLAPWVSPGARLNG